MLLMEDLIIYLKFVARAQLIFVMLNFVKIIKRTNVIVKSIEFYMLETDRLVWSIDKIYNRLDLSWKQNNNLLFTWVANLINIKTYRTDK